MINIIKDKYIHIIKNELIRKGLVEEFIVNLGKYSVEVTMKTDLSNGKAELLATKAMMCLCTGMFGNVKVKIV